MKTSTVGLQTFLLTRQPFLMVDLYTFTTVGGVSFYYVTAAKSFTFNGHVFSALGPYLERGLIKEAVGLNVSSCDITIIADPSHQINSEPFLAALAAGYLDGAQVLIQRLYMPTWGDISLGAVTRFSGQIAESQVGRNKSTLSVRSRMDLLNVQAPKNVYTPGCRHVLFDAGCTLSQAAYTSVNSCQAGGSVKTFPTNLFSAGSVNPPLNAPTITSASRTGANLNARTYFAVVTYVTADGETIGSPEGFANIPQGFCASIAHPPSVTDAVGWNVYIGSSPGGEQKQNGSPIVLTANWGPEPITGLVQGAPPPTLPSTGYYDEGMITFTSGLNSGVSRWVEHFSGGTVTVVPNLPFVPAAGDTFSIVPGCDKALSTCRLKFNNAVHYGGEPFIPSPNSVI